MLQALYISGHGWTAHDTDTGEYIPNKNGEPLATNKEQASELAEHYNAINAAGLGSLGHAMNGQGIH